MDFHPLRKIHPVREIGNVFPGMDAQGLTVKQDLSFGCCQQAVEIGRASCRERVSSPV